MSEVYLHSDIPCGVHYCHICDNNEPILDPESTIFILSHDTLKKHLDMISQSMVFRNLVIPMHSLNFLSAAEKVTLQQLIDHSNKNIYIYPTLYSEETFIPLEQVIAEKQYLIEE